MGRLWRTAWRTMFESEKIEDLLQLTHLYFAHSPKWQSKFVKLADMMGTNDFHMLCNVKTRWISLVEPLKRVLSEYRVQLAKMGPTHDHKHIFRCTFWFLYFPLNCLLFRLLRGVDLPLLCCRCIIRNFKPYYCGLWSIGLSPKFFAYIDLPIWGQFCGCKCVVLS